MEFETIILEKKEAIATITLNRPEKLNSFTRRMEAEFAAAIQDVSNDDNTRVVIITGAGRAFSAGGDMKTEDELARETDAEKVRKQVRGISRMLIEPVQALPKPVIAMINGVCVGMAFDIALASDVRIGSENARFMIGYTELGRVPGLGGTWLLLHTIGLPRAAELLFTGGFLKAKDAEKYGVLNKLVPASSLKDETMALARRMAAMPSLATRYNKMHLYKMLHMDLSTALDLIAFSQGVTQGSEETKQATAAFLEKRKSKPTG